MLILISIHVPRVEDDDGRPSKTQLEMYFNPRPPCGGRLKLMVFQIVFSDISIHVPRVEDDHMDSNLGGITNISIHVPRVEDDLFLSD